MYGLSMEVEIFVYTAFRKGKCVILHVSDPTSLIPKRANFKVE